MDRHCLSILRIPLLLAFTAALVRPAQSAEQIPNEAVAGWKALRTFAIQDVRGRFDYRRVITVGGAEKKSEAYSIEFGTNATGAFLKRTADGQTQVTAYNPEYVFDATQAAGQSDFSLGALRKGEAVTQVSTAVRDAFEPFLFSGFEICGATLPELVASPNFKLISIKRNSTGQTATMVFKFSSDGSGIATALTGGEAVFATDRNWALTGYNCTTSWGRAESVIRWREMNSSHVPESLERRLYGANDNSLTTETFELKDLQSLTPATAIPVTLADYGLAKSPDKTSGGLSLGQWAAIVGLAVIVLAGAGYVRWRR